MKKESLEGTQIRLYIADDDGIRLREMCQRTGLNHTGAMTMILSAGLAALESNEYRVVLPLAFQVTDAPALSTPPTSKRK